MVSGTIARRLSASEGCKLRINTDVTSADREGRAELGKGVQ